jgi:hypothetical protein
MGFNATFNNISVILWWSVLLVEETGEPGEYHRPVASNHSLSLSHFKLLFLLFYVVKFVGYLQQVGGILQVLRFPPPIKLTTTI